jgi:hypothetical protein
MATNGRISEKDMDDAGVPRILPEHKMRERRSVDVRQQGETTRASPTTLVSLLMTKRSLLIEKLRHNV